jgi:hypothetical protein
VDEPDADEVAGAGEEDDDAALAAVAVMQSPGRTEASVVATVSVNFVAAVHDTATWPDCALCTCMVDPVIAAI